MHIQTNYLQKLEESICMSDRFQKKYERNFCSAKKTMNSFFLSKPENVSIQIEESSHNSYYAIEQQGKIKRTTFFRLPILRNSLIWHTTICRPARSDFGSVRTNPEFSILCSSSVRSSYIISRTSVCSPKSSSLYLKCSAKRIAAGRGL